MSCTRFSDARPPQPCRHGTDGLSWGTVIFGVCGPGACPDLRDAAGARSSLPCSHLSTGNVPVCLSRCRGLWSSYSAEPSPQVSILASPRRALPPPGLSMAFRVVDSISAAEMLFSSTCLWIQTPERGSGF